MVAQLIRAALPLLALGLLAGCGAKEEAGFKDPVVVGGGAKDNTMADWAAKNADNGKPGSDDK